ncbi:sensor histidine kinase [Spirosoma koreense]
MNPASAADSASLGPVAGYLTARREALLNSWRTACETDGFLKGVKSLSREEFTNKVPFLLNVLQQRLRQQPEEGQVDLLAAEHGLHRWQKGYTLTELLTEMHYLGQILLTELRAYWQDTPAIDGATMSSAYEQIALFNSQITSGSVSQFAHLQRRAASSRVEALEKTLAELNQLGHQRSELLRQSSHDLRGSFGAIQGAAQILNQVMDSEQERQQFLEMLLRNLTNSQSLITQLMDLARLEAGQETLAIQSMDAAQLLTDLVAGYQPLAAERGLVLKADGPANLVVDCDPLLLQRILQNLVLNALKHTPTGWVSVSWSQEGESRWLVSVQDSGPGLPSAIQAGSLAQVLDPSPESSAAFGLANSTADAKEAASTKASRSVFSHPGEGIGLSIVKGLCELLRASLEIESKPGEGTLFRIRLAIHGQS